MTFEILSKKRNRLLIISRIVLLVMMVISGFILIFYDSNACKIIFLSIFIYNLTPLTLLGKKKIGKLILGENGIDFVTQEMEFVHLQFREMIHFKFFYLGYLGQIDTGYKRFSWNQGENKLIIKTVADEYEIPFLGEVIDNKKMIIGYTNVLKEHNVKYHFEIDGDIYSNLIEPDMSLIK